MEYHYALKPIDSESLFKNKNREGGSYIPASSLPLATGPHHQRHASSAAIEGANTELLHSGGEPADKSILFHVNLNGLLQESISQAASMTKLPNSIYPMKLARGFRPSSSHTQQIPISQQPNYPNPPNPTPSYPLVPGEQSAQQQEHSRGTATMPVSTVSGASNLQADTQNASSASNVMHSDLYGSKKTWKSTYQYESGASQRSNCQNDMEVAQNTTHKPRGAMGPPMPPPHVTPVRRDPEGLLGNFSSSSNSAVIAPESTLIILDYDDTLLPTNWVAVQHKIGLNDAVPKNMQSHLAELSDLAIQTIEACRKAGRLILLTNASVEWVARSGEKFIPQVWKYLQKSGTDIISARDRWQSTGLPQRLWKLKMFQEAIVQLLQRQSSNGEECSVISIGDGEGEREACLEMCRQMGVSAWLFKSLKLLGQPTCNQLISEHVLIQKALSDILKVRQSLDMAILDYKHCDQDFRKPFSVMEGPVKDNVNFSQGVVDGTNNPITDVISKNAPTLAGNNSLQEQKGGMMNCFGGSRGYDMPEIKGGTDSFIDAISEQLKRIEQ